ncbi:hypothetical protein [Kocuria sp. NPDC057446]|uniref:hypothetical protein n=1 Tax=Kocuria sp. NPDC057446 TaxID=3346137 RepID=UPI0036885BF7
MTEQVQDVQRVEDQVAEMVATVPPELVAEFSQIQLLIDSYGEELTTAQDIADTPTVDADRFNAPALEESLISVRSWLNVSCTDDTSSR